MRLSVFFLTVCDRTTPIRLPAACVVVGKTKFGVTASADGDRTGMREGERKAVKEWRYLNLSGELTALADDEGELDDNEDEE